MAYNPFTQGIKQRSATGYSRISARDLDDMIGAGLSYQSTAAAREAALRRQAEADALEKANYEAQLALDEKKHNELVNAQKDAAESSKWQGIANTAGQLGTTVLALGGAKPIMGAVKALPETLGSAYQYGAGVVDNTLGTTLSQSAREAALNATIDDVLATGTAPQMSQATANLIGNTSATGLESASSLTPEIAPQMLDAGYSEALSNVGGNVTSALDSTVANTVAEKAAEQVAQQAITEGAADVAPTTINAVPSATEPVVEGGLGTGAGVAAADVMAPTTIGEAYAAGGLPAAAGTGVANVASAVAAPLAIITAANMARDAWGGMNKDYSEKNWRERSFDDPFAAVPANAAGWLFGDESKVAAPFMWVGDQFSHYAGNPISKAFSGDWRGAEKELGGAFEGSLNSLGVDKKTAGVVDSMINPGGQFMEDIGNHDYNDAALELAKSGLDPVTRGIVEIGSSLFNSGLTEDQIQDQQARAYAEELQKFAQENPNYSFTSKDVPFDFGLSYGKMWGDVLNMPNAGDFGGSIFTGPDLSVYKGKTPQEIEAAMRLSDADINKMLRDGTFTKYINKIQTIKQQSAYDMANNPDNPFYIQTYGIGG